jgi:anaerobic selenocysteine-containing dehydrogenase
METTRRDFLKVAGVGAAAATVFGFDLRPAYAQLKELKIARAAETRSTCPYCAVGCGVLIYTIGDNAKNVTPQVIHVEQRNAVSEGLIARAGHTQSAPPHEAASAASRQHGMARHFLG